MAARRAMALVLFLLSYFLERASWYGGRSVLFSHATQVLGLSTAQFAWIQFLSLLSAAVTPLLGAGLAAAVGRTPVLAAGAVFSVLGGCGVAFGGTLTLLPGLGLLALGTGLFRATLLGLVGGMFPGRSENLRITAFLLLYGVANLGVLLSTRHTDQVKAQLGLSNAWILVGAALLALAAGVLGTAGGVVAPKEPPTATMTGRSLLGTLVVAFLAIPGLVVLNLSSHFAFRAAAGGDRDALYFLNPVVVMAVVGVLAPLLCALHLARRRIPSLALMAVGMTLLAGGSVLLLLGDTTTLSLLRLSVGVMAVGEVLLLAVGLSRAAGDHPARLSSLGVALWIFLTATPALLSGQLPAEGPWRPWALGMALALTLAAAGGLAVGAVLGRRLFEPGPRQGADGHA